MSMFNLLEIKPRAWKMDCLFYEVVSSELQSFFWTSLSAWCEAEVQIKYQLFIDMTEAIL